jgi:transcriptional regulator with XRE-family HTH domain
MKASEMDEGKRRRLEAAGFKVADTAEFLGLTEEESRWIELRLALSASLRRVREQRGMTQVMLARLLHSSQSRVAKMEGGDPTVSTDLLIRALLATGATLEDVGSIIAAGEGARGG